MNELLDRAVARVHAFPADRRDEFARVLLRLAGEEEQVYQLSAEEEADLIEAEAEIARGEFATRAEVEAVLSRRVKWGGAGRYSRSGADQSSLRHDNRIGACCAPALTCHF